MVKAIHNTIEEKAKSKRPEPGVGIGSKGLPLVICFNPVDHTSLGFYSHLTSGQELGQKSSQHVPMTDISNSKCNKFVNMLVEIFDRFSLYCGILPSIATSN